MSRQLAAGALVFVLVAPAQQPDVAKGDSRIIVRGDLEILTYETEGDFRRLEQLYEESRKASPRPGALTPLYFRSRTDNSVQPYALWLPPEYKPGQRYPLLVQLHGIGPKFLAGRRHFWQGMGVPQWIDPHAPVIIAHCYGRGNTFYQGMGEVDVLEAIDDIRSRFSVDEDRIYLMGHSMGGAGAYTLGLHYPDRFGSITPIDAAMGMRSRAATPTDVPAWMKPQIAIWHFANLYGNARNVPVYFKNAGAGIQGRSTEFSDGVVAEGGFSTAESFPGMPHHFAPQLSYAIFTAQAVALPIRRNPAEIKFYTNTLRYNRAYWVTIDRLGRHNQDARIAAAYDDGKPRPQPGRRPGAAAAPPGERPPLLTITTSNIEALTLRLAGLAVSPQAPLRVDGQELLAGSIPQTVHLVREGSWRIVSSAAESGKRHGLQGPIGDAFLSKFLAVYGEGDRDLATAELDALRNPPGRLVIHGDFPMKSATRLTTEDIRASNLILFGTPSSNVVLKRLAPRLPKALVDASAVFIQPNPENPDRYVVVWPTRLLSLPDNGLSTGYILPVHLLPDYVVVREGKIGDAGHFDSDWRLKEDQ